MISQQILRGPGGTILSVFGTFRATLRYKECQISETVFVLKDQFYSLFSKKARVDLGLIVRIGEVNTSKFHWRISSAFQWSGKTGNQISDQAQPRCNATLHLHPRKVPHPLLPKVKNEIDSMLRQAILSPVTVPTEWCSGIALVPKPNRCVQVCRPDTIEQSVAARSSSYRLC